MKIFADRADAGRQLAQLVSLSCEHLRDPVVLALPRGGLPVALEVAKRLGADLDVMLVRKLGAPMQPELAVGAIATGRVMILEEHSIEMLGIRTQDLESVIEREQRELARRELTYRGGRDAPDLRGRTVLLVDDGVATGATMRAAISAARQQGADRVIVAVPTAAKDSARLLAREADQFVCIDTPEPYMAVGYWYANFRQVIDAEVIGILHDFHAQRAT